MEFISYKKDENKITLTGTITSMPDYCRFMTIGDVTRPILSFDLTSYRKMSKDGEVKFDENTIVVLDDDSFFEKFEVGDRIRLTGELQSRNFTRSNPDIDEMISIAVANYIEIYEELPTQVVPINNQRYPILWDKIIESGLLPYVPHDSMFLADGKKAKSAERPFVYRLDAHGEVFKESEDTTFEIIAKNSSITKIEEPFDPSVGDKNIIVVFGEASREPIFDIFGDENTHYFTNFSVKTASKNFTNRIFYNNIICWGNLAEDTFNNISKGDLVKVIGRLQSRKFKKEFTKRWTTAGGNRKKKTTEFEIVTHEISATSIQKGYIPKNKNKGDQKKSKNEQFRKQKFLKNKKETN